VRDRHGAYQCSLKYRLALPQLHPQSWTGCPTSGYRYYCRDAPCLLFSGTRLNEHMSVWFRSLL
jgi:hypothetical protein